MTVYCHVCDQWFGHWSSSLWWVHRQIQLSLPVLASDPEPVSERVVAFSQFFTVVGLAIVVFLLVLLLLLNYRKKQVISRKSKELAETEARYRLLFQHSPIPLLVEDLSAIKCFFDQLAQQKIDNFQAYFSSHPESLRRCAAMVRIVDANQAALRVYGADRPEELARLTSLLPEEQFGAYRAELIGLAKEGRAEVMLEHRTLAGQYLMVELRSVVAVGFEESWQKVFVSVFDITEQVKLRSENKAFEKQLQQTQKLEAIGSLAGGIAHDFNNILSPIMGRAELMQVENRQDLRVHDHCQGIIDAAKRARDLVRQILTFSRQVDQEIKPVSLVEIVSEVIALVRPTLPATIDIQSDLPLHCPPVMADEGQLHQVLMNLITNAFHAMEDNGGLLSLKLEAVNLGGEEAQQLTMAPGAYLRLRVSDTGHGMDEQTLAKMYDPYFTTKPRGKGTGLGLSVVVGILRGYGGEIRVQSKMGQGTVFTLYLPAMQLEVGETAPTEGFPQNNCMPRGQEHILLVDDEKSIADVTASMLERLGYHVTVRISSHDALEAFRSLHAGIDLLVTDLTMPQMTGMQLYQEMRNIRPDIKVIICTGFSEQMDHRNSRLLGVQGFLNKPVVMADLAHCVRAVLDG